MRICAAFPNTHTWKRQDYKHIYNSHSKANIHNRSSEQNSAKTRLKILRNKANKI